MMQHCVIIDLFLSQNKCFVIVLSWNHLFIIIIIYFIFNELKWLYLIQPLITLKRNKEEYNKIK